MHGDGTQTRDFVFAPDVATAYVAACGARADGLRVNIGTGLETSVRQLHTELARLCDAPDAPVPGPARLGELERSALDATRAREVLDRAPRTSLRDGLAATVAWMGTEIAVRTDAPPPSGRTERRQGRVPKAGGPVSSGSSR